MKDKKKIIIVTVKQWNIDEAKKFVKSHQNLNITVITRKKDLTSALIKEIDPHYIFFPHWSWRIPKHIYDQYPCIAFHMTDLPFGRGGGPLQNLIVRGIKKTKISAIKVIEAFDAGPVYMKHPLQLKGSAQEIYSDCAKLIFSKMIPQIIKTGCLPKPQKGEAVVFKRRTPEESKIPAGGIDLSNFYDYIRMLDADGYPKAFIETGDFKIEFSNAVKNRNQIEAKVTIKPRKAK